jgi:hypothetical protein
LPHRWHGVSPLHLILRRLHSLLAACQYDHVSLSAPDENTPGNGNVAIALCPPLSSSAIYFGLFPLDPPVVLLVHSIRVLQSMLDLIHAMVMFLSHVCQRANCWIRGGPDSPLGRYAAPVALGGESLRLLLRVHGQRLGISSIGHVMYQCQERHLFMVYVIL